MATVNRFGHIDLRVNDMEAACAFYKAVMPALGFELEFPGETWRVFASRGRLPAASFFAIVEDPEHRANGNRIAFWADDREAVDRLGAVVREAGAEVESGPRECPEYSSTYYGLFFRDPCGNCLEVYHRTD